MSELLRLTNVGVKYERRKGRWKFEQFWALKDVSFSINQGDSIGIVGRNGAGKSTLLRLLAGIYKADRGKFEQLCSFTSSLIALNVGLSAQLSGRDNVVLGALLLGLKKNEALAIVDEVKDYSELGDFFEQPVMTYSSGMKARLGFAIAYYANPEVILMDEVVGGVGDKTFVEKSQKAMEEKLSKANTTLILVSHNTKVLKEFCNKAIWIEEGKVFMQGDSEQVLNAYMDAS